MFPLSFDIKFYTGCLILFYVFFKGVRESRVGWGRACLAIKNEPLNYDFFPKNKHLVTFCSARGEGRNSSFKNWENRKTDWKSILKLVSGIFFFLKHHFSNPLRDTGWKWIFLAFSLFTWIGSHAAGLLKSGYYPMTGVRITPYFFVTQLYTSCSVPWKWSLFPCSLIILQPFITEWRHYYLFLSLSLSPYFSLPLSSVPSSTSWVIVLSLSYD